MLNYKKQKMFPEISFPPRYPSMINNHYLNSMSNNSFNANNYIECYNSIPFINYYGSQNYFNPNNQIIDWYPYRYRNQVPDYQHNNHCNFNEMLIPREKTTRYSSGSPTLASNWNLNYSNQDKNQTENINYPTYNMYKDYFNFKVFLGAGSRIPESNRTTSYQTHSNKGPTNYQNNETGFSKPSLMAQSTSGAIRTDEFHSSNPHANIDKKYTVTWEPREKRVKRCGVIFISKTPCDNNPSGETIENYKFLVVKGVSGIWSFPKGRCLPNELDEDCAMRELYEETGIKLNSLKNNKRFKIGTNVYYKYECSENQFTDFTIHDTNEVEEVAWKSIHELRQLVCNKDIRSLLNYKTRVYTYHTNIFN